MQISESSACDSKQITDRRMENNKKTHSLFYFYLAGKWRHSLNARKEILLLSTEIKEKLFFSHSVASLFSSSILDFSA